MNPLKENIKSRIIAKETTIIQALKKMEELAVKLLFIFDREQFIGILSIGDIQRSVIKNIDLKTSVIDIMRPNFTFSLDTERKDSIKEKMIKFRIECMPILNNNKQLVDAIFWNDIISNTAIKKEKIEIPVVIMAGGKGTRLQPLTNIYPKPLIPIGEKTIVESIMDTFVSYGCHDFYFSVNYKADVIKNYFDFLNNAEYNISYFQEEKPMGTAGSLRLLKNKISTTFFVSNCDILINEDYSKILSYHKKNQNELTVVAALKTYSIPYGTIQTGEDGLLDSIEEKPDLTFKINTGLYILEPSLLDDIPDDFFHITHLMEKLHKQNRRVGVYPISQNDWIDMGDWNEYLKLIKQ